jgi:serine/threonine-protein kinase RsbT
MTSQTKSHNYTINNDSDVLQATYDAMSFTRELGFSAVQQSMVSTAVSELASNIVKYAGKGYITVSSLQQMGQTGIEVIAEDRGPGITDRAHALTDHISTGNTLGLGLPGVKRLMDEFLMDSSEGYGTKIVTRKWKLA